MSTKMWNLLLLQEASSKLSNSDLTLEQLFNKADQAETTHAALKLMDSFEYDLLVYDITTNAKEGFQFSKHVRQMKPKLPIFVMVSPDDESQIGDLLDLGINAFVLTPDQFTQAMQTIADLDLA